MSCNCNGCGQPPKLCRCPKKNGTPRAYIKECSDCDPCKPCESMVKICSFVVPTLTEGQVFRNSFVYNQEDDAVYYITDDGTPIRFGASPMFIDYFDPSSQTPSRQIVFDFEDKKAYVYNPEGEYLAVDLVGSNSQEVHLTVDYDHATWTMPTYGIRPAYTNDLVYESTVSDVVFTNNSSSETYTAEQLFELLDGGTKVVLDNVPLGWYVDPRNPSYQINPDFVVDSVRFEQVAKYISPEAECPDPRTYHGLASVGGVIFVVSLEKGCSGDTPVYSFKVQGHGPALE